MSKVKALRNFSGPKSMILRGMIIEVSEPYVSDWTAAGLIEVVPEIPVEEAGYKTMKTKRNAKVKDASNK